MLAVSAVTPVGWAYPPSVGGELKDCYYVEVTIPSNGPILTRVCRPVPPEIEIEDP